MLYTVFKATKMWLFCDLPKKSVGEEGEGWNAKAAGPEPSGAAQPGRGAAEAALGTSGAARPGWGRIQTAWKRFSIWIKESELHRKEVTASILYINRLYPHSLFLTVLLTIEHYLRTYCIHR